jgi:hypothetical protein
VDIVDSGDNVTEINADAQFNAMRVQDIGIPLSHRLLQRDGTSHRLNRTREFHQNAVAFDPYNPPGMSLDAWPNHVLQYTLQTAPRSDLVLTSKPAIPDHVGKQDCCQATLHALLRHRVPSRSIRPVLALDTIAKTNDASLHLNSLVAEKQITPHGAPVFFRLLGSARRALAAATGILKRSQAQRPSDKQCEEAQPSSAADARVALCRPGARARSCHGVIARLCAERHGAISLSATVGYAAKHEQAVRTAIRLQVPEPKGGRPCKSTSSQRLLPYSSSAPD